MFPWILCSILIVVIFLLIIKILSMQKSIDEICREFYKRLLETNTRSIFPPGIPI